MTTVTTCSNLAEAQLLKGLLNAAGIPAFVPDELTANTAPQFVFGSGIRLQVDDENVEDALLLLADAETHAGAKGGKTTA